MITQLNEASTSPRSAIIPEPTPREAYTKPYEFNGCNDNTQVYTKRYVIAPTS